MVDYKVGEKGRQTRPQIVTVAADDYEQTRRYLGNRMSCID